MKITKILSAAAACAVAATALAATASAELATTSGSAALSSGTAMWMMKLYVPNEGVDFGIDCTQIGSVVFTIAVQDGEEDYFEGQIGGAITVSSGPVLEVDHNWPQKSFWGVEDAELGLSTYGDGNDLQSVKVGDYTYQITCPVDDTNNVIPEAYADESAYVQVALNDWSTDISVLEVLSLDVLDTNGNSLIAFDGEGNVVSSNASAAPAEDTAPAEDADTTAPAATDSKGSPDTGVEGIAAVAGVAVVAAGAIALSRKRK